ncbi:MAG TPA: 50S ribosomal protein L11 methyltransferase [Polyangia bacterium]|nr:50S ribosomal protein L11 methyltransferase [Polyangia bacterium]
MNVHTIPRILEYHGDMLADAVRVGAFRRALDAVIKPGDVVLDLGAGTGIMSALACRAGASRVYLMEEGPVMAFAEEVLSVNGFGARVVPVRGLSTGSQLPEPVDVIVSETIGVAGFDEGILGYVIDARRRFTRPGQAAPRMIPGTLSLWAAPVTASIVHENCVRRWAERPVELDLGPLHRRASNHLYIRRIEPDWLAAPGQELASADLHSVGQTMLQGRARYTFSRATTVHGFAVWFESELAPGIRLSNEPGPFAANANVGDHWSHGFLPVIEPLAIAAGAELTLELDVDDGMLWRWSGGVEGGARFDQCTASGMPSVRA